MLMGGTWCLHVLLDDRQTEYGYLTGVFSCLVGVFFFVFFACKKKILQLLRKKIAILYVAVRPLRQKRKSEENDQDTVKNLLPIQEVKTSQNRVYKNEMFITCRNPMVEPITETRV